MVTFEREGFENPILLTISERSVYTQDLSSTYVFANIPQINSESSQLWFTNYKHFLRKRDMESPYLKTIDPRFPLYCIHKQCRDLPKEEKKPIKFYFELASYCRVLYMMYMIVLQNFEIHKCLQCSKQTPEGKKNQPVLCKECYSELLSIKPKEILETKCEYCGKVFRHQSAYTRKRQHQRLCKLDYEDKMKSTKRIHIFVQIQNKFSVKSLRQNLNFLGINMQKTTDQKHKVPKIDGNRFKGNIKQQGIRVQYILAKLQQVKPRNQKLSLYQGFLRKP